MFLGLRTVIYQVSDLDSAKAWYAKVLGVAPYFDEPYYVGFAVNGFELGLQSDTPSATAVANVIAYWGVGEDIEVVYAHLLACGATPRENDPANPENTAIVDVGGGIRVAEVRDPFGNVFAIMFNPHFGK
jgi:catechol 2,3-dioxygenase-like lactoylglutathione lyase family enzyme